MHHHSMSCGAWIKTEGCQYTFTVPSTNGAVSQPSLISSGFVSETGGGGLLTMAHCGGGTIILESSLSTMSFC